MASHSPLDVRLHASVGLMPSGDSLGLCVLIDEVRSSRAFYLTPASGNTGVALVSPVSTLQSAKCLLLGHTVVPPGVSAYHTTGLTHPRVCSAKTRPFVACM